MRVLFFVHTPLQLFVAQQIIYQEQLDEVVFLLGTNGNNPSFYQAYDLMLSDDISKYKIYRMDYLSEWALITRRKIFMDIKKVLANEKIISEILISEKVDVIYLGDMNDISYKFTSFLYKRRGYKIYFYEEGLSHYYDTPYYARYKAINSIFCFFLDLFFYLPFYHFTFGRYMLRFKHLSYSELPIDCRYSVLDFYHEKYDKRVCFSYVNKSLEHYIIDSTKSNDNSKITLFLSQPIYEYWGNFDLYLSVLKSYLKLNSEIFYIIKYHPREKKQNKDAIENLFKTLNINYSIISQNIPIPVEAFLIYFKPKTILMFGSSSLKYIPYLSPESELIMLMGRFIKICEDNNYDVKELKPLFEDTKKNNVCEI